MASIAITPVSGSITHASTVCRIDVTAAEDNDDTAYNAALYPASPALVYYLLIDGSDDDGKSYAFTPASDGTHTFNNYIFPAAGSYTVRLRDSSDDSDIATLGVTVA